jgi:LysR family transcriptional regulator, regulator for metE and metH
MVPRTYLGGMSLSLRQLRLVQHVARERTLTAAARTLHVTQSALSHQLTKLERQLRTPVFVRSGRNMVPTAAGLRILEAAEDALGVIRELEDDLREITRGRRGTLRLTASCYTCYHWLPEVLPAFHEHYPDVDVVLVPELSTRALPALVEGEADVVLTYDPLDDDGPLDAAVLFADEQVVVVAPGHRLAGRTFVEAGDLAEEHLMLHYGTFEESLFARSVLKPAGVRPRRISEVRSTEAVLGLVAAGAGVAALTRWTAAPEIASGRVIALQVGSAGLYREWKAVRLRAPHVPGYVDAFRELLRAGPARLFEKPERAAERREAGIVLRAVR